MFGICISNFMLLLMGMAESSLTLLGCEVMGGWAQPTLVCPGDDAGKIQHIIQVTILREPSMQQDFTRCSANSYPFKSQYAKKPSAVNMRWEDEIPSRSNSPI